MMTSNNDIVHLFAGGVGGTVAAIVTCPLEVVKVRLQSSVASSTFHPVYMPSIHLVPAHSLHANLSTYAASATNPTFQPCVVAEPEHAMRPATNRVSVGIFKCLRQIIQKEGTSALFKGLGPNLIGVAPSRAVYFCAYAKAKRMLNDNIAPNTPLVHIGAACMAGFMSSTLTNPIWYVKTRLQLDQNREAGRLTCRQCIHQTLKQHGWRGFYKGVTASYAGISETVIHFVIYEAIKAHMMRRTYPDYVNSMGITPPQSNVDFLRFMAAAALSKSFASVIAYPHEVARTRLREDGDKYRRFFQTLKLVFLEERWRGLYGGLTTQLVRQIPNTAIMMATYEAVVYTLSTYEQEYATT